MALTDDELAILVAWFATVELPPRPFRNALWAEIAEPEQWWAVMLHDLRVGPAAGSRFQTALIGVRWLAKRIAPPAVQAAARVNELGERHGPAF